MESTRGMNSEQDNLSGSYRRFFIVRFYIFVHYRSKDEKINRTQFETSSESSENGLEWKWSRGDEERCETEGRKWNRAP
jgi:hypothetical protein